MARPSRNEFTSRVRGLTDRIREDIRTGKLAPGHYLPSELELAGTFGLSKESVRKALDVLVEEGLITKIKRVGNRVEPRTMLRFAYYPSMEAEVGMAERLAAFEAAHPGISVQPVPTPFPAEYIEHGVADVAALTNWDAMKWRERDPAFARLERAPHTEAAHPRLHRPFLAADGGAAAAPFVFSPVVLAYNRAHLSSCGLEEPRDGWTWYTLLKTARALERERRIAGFGAHMQSVNRWTVFLLQNGFRFGEPATASAADDPSLWESLRVARDLVHRQGEPLRHWTENDADAERWFQEGRISMIMTSYFGLHRLRIGELDYGVSKLPMLRNDATLLLVTGLIVAKDAKHPEAARSLVSYLCGLEGQSDIRRSALTLPAHPGALRIRDGLTGNRPSREPDLQRLWDGCKDYADLHLTTTALEAIREELKGYWAKLEDETEAGSRLESIFAGG